MNTIVAELIRIIKGAKDSIDSEEKIRHYFEELQCQAVGAAWERIDAELSRQYKEKGWKTERRDERTIQASFGAVTFKRRLMKKEGEKSIYPLDHEIGIRPYQRYTAYMEYTVAQIGARSVYRTTAAAVSALSPVTMSHQQVARIIREAGQQCKKWEDEQRETYTEERNELKKPEYLYIEGDGLLIHRQGQDGKKTFELHRYQIAEGVKQNGKRRELVGAHYVSGFSAKEAREALEGYLADHYDLRDTVVLSNSDGGAGYGKEAFDGIIGKAKRHEHFRDRYHVNRKLKERLSGSDKRLAGELRETVRAHDKERMEVCMDTLESMAADGQEAENLVRLRGYLERNWEYLATPEQRGLESCGGCLGTCESNHRLYSYRMKKQGRAWGDEGGAAMARILTAIKNGDLREALAARKDYSCKPSRDFKGAVRAALKKAKHSAHEGVRHGRIVVDAPSSSAIGQLARMIA
ncbi:MAG: ISLre2 family transposase [Selenomonadaceae bacterium]|nr:ISLre2 family transposase [Selenomonadaceae bacterium]